MGEVKDYPPYLDYPKPRKPMTNADRIRAMTDEELADIMGPYECVGCPVETETGECLQEGENCHKALLRWLKSPVEVDK